jgi:phenylalanyl-tRNA synthetase alpha chain
MEIEEIEKKAKEEIERTKNLKELDEIYKKYLGPKGEISLIFEGLKNLSPQKRIEIGEKTNKLKALLENLFLKKKEEIEEKIEREIEEKEWIDITVPGKKILVGHLHPLTQVLRKVEDIFQNLGFEVVEGPEIEDEWHNFDALNIPKDHPARDLWNTLYLKSQIPNLKSQILLRTHTSPVQVRYMEKNNPPLRIIVPGRVFRHEATDASHEINFYQVEGLMVDEKGKISIANFRAIIEKFYEMFFEKKIEVRLRPSYFPFTEPSFEVDITCLVCGGKGCSACQKTGWMEMMGAGMVHPEVFKNSGLNPKFYQGFAFGMGIERLAMMKYKIDDIRLFYSGDLRFLNQF